jgi:hypothetical protein
MSHRVDAETFAQLHTIRENRMTAPRWEYKSLLIDVTGFWGPNIDSSGLEEVLNQHGSDGWELVSAFDINRGHGATAALMVLLKRPR